MTQPGAVHDKEKEQIVFTKKGEWWLIVDSVWVIEEFGLPSDS